jgi:3-hydroxy acid dehydrogenase/malonic semialdehyde reductase|tara:strand:+ start:1141 stop:1848 length:708 start_codon:yes stop_codon:yes gene_type:complete
MIKERKVLVTGSSDGIGRSITLSLLKSGAKVIGLARDHSKFNPETKNYIKYKTDFSNEEILLNTIAKIIKDHKDLDCLVSNAGFGKFGTLETFSTKEINDFIFTNLTSHMILTNKILPHLKKIRKGNIIFIGSESALKGGKNGSLYSAAKFGLRGFSQSIREESCSKNIHVSLINPGMVRTSFFNNLDFMPGEDKSNAIEPDDIGKIIIDILSTRNGSVIEEINLSPLKKVIKFL